MPDNRDDSGREHARHFPPKVDAQQWLDEQTSKPVTGTHITQRLARTTGGEWADQWLRGYGTRKPSTVRQTEVHLKKIKAAFGTRQLGSVRPSEVRVWCAALGDEGSAPSTTLSRLSARLRTTSASPVVPRDSHPEG